MSLGCAPNTRQHSKHHPFLCFGWYPDKIRGHARSDLVLTPQERIYIWYCKLSQKPVAGEVGDPSGESIAAGLLNGHAMPRNGLPNNHVCAHRTMPLSTPVREASFCSDQRWLWRLIPSEEQREEMTIRYLSINGTSASSLPNPGNILGEKRWKERKAWVRWRIRVRR